MKLIDRYITTSIIKISIVSIALIVLVMTLFDMFSNLERYVNMEVPLLQMVVLTVLEAPNAVVIALGPALLFSTTYVLSMLQANNELIVIYNAGFPYRRLIVSCIVLALLASLFQFAFNETVAINASREHQLLSKERLGTCTADANRNVSSRAEDCIYVIHAGRYYDESLMITNVTVVFVNEDGSIALRIDAPSGVYNGRYWELKDAVSYKVKEEPASLDIASDGVYHNEKIDLESNLFRNLTADIASMELSDAINYVRRIRYIDPNRYIAHATDLQERLWISLTPLILTVISCSTLFRWKKNVLILSIISSLSIAVIFFVAKMLGTIFAKQGILSPLAGAIAPLLLMLFISALAGIFVRK